MQLRMVVSAWPPNMSSKSIILHSIASTTQQYTFILVNLLNCESDSFVFIFWKQINSCWVAWCMNVMETLSSVFGLCLVDHVTYKHDVMKLEF